MFNKIKILFNFIKKYLFKDTMFFFSYMYLYYIKDKKLHAIFYNNDEIINIIKSNKSILRLGDGEIGLLHNNPIIYQKWSREIKSIFKNIITSYNDDSNYVLSIPVFVNNTNIDLDKLPTTRSRSKIFVWMPLRATFLYLFNKKAKYIDAHIFYKYKYANIVGDYLFTKNTKTIIMVTDKNTIESIKNNINNNKNLSKIKLFIETPSENSFEIREYIKNSIIKLCEDNNLNKNNSIILWKGGLAKSIISEMSFKYQFIDIGKGFDSYINKTPLDHLI